MTPDTVIQVGEEALFVICMLAAPPLLSALAVGLLIGLFQAATQIQEMTLSFIPKLIAVVVALFVAGAWMLNVITDYTVGLYESIPMIIG